MGHLARAVLRALLQAPGRMLAVVSLVAMAITVYAGTFIGLGQIQATTDTLYRELRLFDLELRLPPTALDGLPDAATLLASVPGLRAATFRLLVPGTVELSGARVAGAVVCAVPPPTHGERPQVGDVLLVSGEYLLPGRPGEVVIDKTFAEDMGLRVGDQLTLRVQGREVPVTIRGIGVFPEFLMSSVDSNYPVPIRKTVTAILLSQELVEREMETALANSLAVQVRPGWDREAVAAALREVLGQAGTRVTATLRSEDQYSVHCNRTRLASYRDSLPALVVVFNGLAFLVLVLLVRRMVQVFHKELATLLCFGVRRTHIVLAWAGVIALLVAAGGVVGTGGALWLARRVSGQYLITGFPLILPGRSLVPLRDAWLLCLLFVVPAVVLPMIPILRLPPARLLRDDLDGGDSALVLGWARRVDGSLGRLLGYPEQLGLRNVLRRPALFLSSTACIGGMLVAAASMYLFAEALGRGMDEFLSSQRWDYLIELGEPAGEEDLGALLRRAGATSWEGFATAEGTLRHRGMERSYKLVAAPVPSALRRESGIIWGRGLEADGPGPGMQTQAEVVVNLRLALLFGLSPGDELEVAVGERAGRLRVAGVMNNYAINEAFVSPATLQRLLGHPLLHSGALLTGPAALGLRLSREPAVARVVPEALIAESSRTGCAVLMNAVRLYGHLSTLVGAILILVTISVSITDRAAEYALLRSLGFTALDLLRSLLCEAILIFLLAVVISLPLTRLATWIFQQRLMRISDWVPLSVSVSSWLRVMAPALGLMLLSVLPALRRAMRIPAADVLRARIGG